jgi:serine/threonine-protein kinase
MTGRPSAGGSLRGWLASAGGVMSEDFSLPATGVDAPAGAGLAPGSRVAGYLLEEQIGRGGMAVVFRARDERLGRQVALKLLAPVLASDDGFRQRFIGESRKAAAVDDPHIIPVHEAGEAAGMLFIAMRYVPGGDVGRLVRHLGPLPAAKAAAIISPVASALDAAHAAGLVHRDVKPANMLLDVRPGRPDHVYLADFGLSKEALSSGGLTRSGQVLGTLNYCAPEQIEGKAVDGRTDQYGLACAAFEMLTGAPPFLHEQVAALMWAHLSDPPPPVTARRPDLPPAANAVLARALAKAPGDRYASCRDFSDALRQAFGLVPYDSDPGTASPLNHAPTEVAQAAAEPIGPPVGASTLVTRAVNEATRPRLDQPVPADVAPTGQEPVAVPVTPSTARASGRQSAIAGAVLLLLAGAAGAAGTAFPGPLSKGAYIVIVYYVATVAVAGLALARPRALVRGLLLGMWSPTVAFLAYDLVAIIGYHSFRLTGSGLAAFRILDISDALGVIGLVCALVSVSAGTRHRALRLRGLPAVIFAGVTLCGAGLVAVFASWPSYKALNITEGSVALFAGVAIALYAISLDTRTPAAAVLLGWAATTGVILVDPLPAWSALPSGVQVFSVLSLLLLASVVVLAISYPRQHPDRQPTAPAPALQG